MPSTKKSMRQQLFFVAVAAVEEAAVATKKALEARVQAEEAMENWVGLGATANEAQSWICPGSAK